MITDPKRSSPDAADALDEQAAGSEDAARQLSATRPGDEDAVVTSAVYDVRRLAKADEGGRRDPSKDPTLLGRYKIQEILGRGAFSIVYRASQVGIGRSVALKVFLLPPTSRQNPKTAEAALARFQREARLAAGLRHPHTVTLFDYDKTDAGILYMAFEFIEGPTLSKEIKAKPGGLPIPRAVDVARQVALSLAEAHEQGIIHRDLKPGNIMLTQRLGQDDYVKVLDFGIAKLIGNTERNLDFDAERSNVLEVLDLIEPAADSVDLTLNGRIVGTPRYIPPEQIRGEDLTPAADIYALGLILHEMITGSPANPGKKAHELITWHLEDLPFDMPPGFACPPGLAHVIQKATRKDPAARYQSCKELLADLDRLDARGGWIKAPGRSRAILVAAALNVLLIALLSAVALTLLNSSSEDLAAQAPRGSQAALAPAEPADGAAGDDDPSGEAVQTPSVGTINAVDERKAALGEEGLAGAKSPSEGEPAPEPPAQVQIESVPPDAAIFIGNLRIGRTPMALTLDPNQSELNLTIKKPGFRDQSVQWSPQAQSPFPVKLKPAPRNVAPTPDKKPNYRILP